MNRNAFLKLLTQRLYPVLRAEGFVGSGQTLKRIDGPVIHVFNVQGSAKGSECYLNLGAHLAFLPTEGGGEIDPPSIEESHCVFRDRMDPPPGPEFGWVYGETAEAAKENVEFIVSEWPNRGHAFFDRYARYPQSFEQLLQDSDANALHARTNLHLARIAMHLGREDVAREFVRVGLAKASERAMGLKADLEGVLRG